MIDQSIIYEGIDLDILRISMIPKYSIKHSSDWESPIFARVLTHVYHVVLSPIVIKNFHQLQDTECLMQIFAPYQNKVMLRIKHNVWDSYHMLA